MNIEQPVTVTLDRERTLRYDFAAFRAIEDRTGVSIIRDGYTSEDLKKEAFFVVALWAGLMHEDLALTVSKVERLVLLKDYPRVRDAILIALRQSAGEPEPETEDPHAVPPAAPASGGLTSGAEHGSISG